MINENLNKYLLDVNIYCHINEIYIVMNNILPRLLYFNVMITIVLILILLSSSFFAKTHFNDDSKKFTVELKTFDLPNITLNDLTCINETN